MYWYLLIKIVATDFLGLAASGITRSIKDPYICLKI